MSSEENRTKIVETALQMFSSRGCKGVTMDDIATAMHMSKRTLYETFSNKEELLAECLMRVHDSVGALHREVLGKVEEPMLVAMYMLRANVDFNHKHHRLIEEAERYYPDIHDRFFKVHTEAFRGMVAHGIDYLNGHHYLRPDANLKVAVDFLCRQIQSRRMSEVSDPQSYKQQLGEICFTYMRGLMTTETIARYERSEPRFRQMLEELKLDNHFLK